MERRCCDASRNCGKCKSSSCQCIWSNTFVDDIELKTQARGESSLLRQVLVELTPLERCMWASATLSCDSYWLRICAVKQKIKVHNQPLCVRHVSMRSIATRLIERMCSAGCCDLPQYSRNMLLNLWLHTTEQTFRVEANSIPRRIHHLQLSGPAPAICYSCSVA